MVCLWPAGSRLCTQEALDTLSPSWGCAFPAISASTLMAGIDGESFDNDRSTAGVCAETVAVAPGDAICTKGKVTFTTDNFKTKTWKAGCGTTMTWNATLTPL
jgi:hypothetical protein